ncbi:MAG: hypothetical protein ACYSOF_04160 [Planctomycetota bacterium]|jgi:hypothetical protein
MKKTFLLLIILLFVSANGIAGVWDPPAGSNLSWCNSDNWGFFGVPDSTDIVTVNGTDEGTARIDTGCYAEAAQLIISQFGNDAAVKVYPGSSLHVYGDTTLGNYSATGTLEINSNVTIDGNLKVGYYHTPRGVGILKMYGGYLDVGGDVNLGDQGGDGVLEMTGGTIDITGELSMLNGHIQLNGGIIYADNLFFSAPHGTFDIRGDARLVLWRDLSSTVHWISGITACNGQGTVIIDYYSNVTIIRTECVCPEADLTGDCLVNLEDLAAIADQWLDGAS